jgi:hypothetical protein
MTGPGTTDIIRLLERREEDLWFMLKRLNQARDDALALLKQERGNSHSEAEAAHLRLRIMLISTELDFIAERRRELSNGRGRR